MFNMFLQPKPKYPLVFVHVPKAAGTSFRASLAAAVGKKKICFDYRGASGLISPEVSQWLIDENKPAQFREVFDRKGYIALSGHYPADRYSDLFDISSFVAFVRRPFDYLNSVYRHRLRHNRTDKSFAEFIEDPKLHNRQSYFLARQCWPAFACVGVTERFSESLDVINHHFGLSLVEKRKNIDAGRKNKISEKAQQHAKADMSQYESRINELNRLDLALYEQVNHCLDNRLAMIRQQKAMVRGGVSLLNSGLVKVSIAEDGMPLERAEVIVQQQGAKQRLAFKAESSKNGMLEMNSKLSDTVNKTTNFSLLLNGSEFPLQYWQG
ncbi:sulfotransferase family protein [Neiella marina]|uniref:Sulfotransferase family protein n=1 Tax=Neiella holothuriorum TaxID=2870530 RepID=A0ABS7EEU1_9GAMM|nr:sulfotransferase family 2 domain-containing protein [Neiella holothuriorum]MBW8190739.1 sulfotransferase family protein [Neiella holothuriorum]